MSKKLISKDKLIKCIEDISNEFGLTTGEFKNYIENRLSTAEDLYKSVYPKVPNIVITGDKMYISNLKVMLAQNLYSAGKIVKMTDKYSVLQKIPNPPIRWYISEKWDGIRAIWDGEKFVSRGGGAQNPKVFTYVPDFFKELMPPGIAIDGEMWIARGQFKLVSGLSNLKVGKSKTKQQINKIWKGTNSTNGVKYKVYDLPGSNQPFETRMKFLKQIVNDRN